MCKFDLMGDPLQMLATMLLSQHRGSAILGIFWERDKVRIPKLYELRFDLIRLNHHKLMFEQIHICVRMTGIFQHQCKGG